MAIGIGDAAPKEAELGSCEIVLHDDGGAAAAAARQCRSNAVEVILKYGRPEIAAGIAILGLGAGGRSLLARLGSASGGGGVLQEEEVRSRLGALPPGRVSEELRLGPVELATRHAAGSLNSSLLKEEVRELQLWRDQASAAVACLEKRSAMSFLGLPMDAEPEAVQKSYKQRALALHPDKGGSEEEFMHLQEMHDRIQAEETREDGKGRGKGFFDQLIHLKKVKEDRDRDDMPEDVKMAHSRQLLNRQALDLWQRATTAQRDLTGTSIPLAQQRPAIVLLQQFVEGFRHEATSLPRGMAAIGLAERIFWKFVRQGVEVITAASLTDHAATVAHVASHFTGVLLRGASGGGPCVKLRRYCGALLEAIAEVPRAFDAEIKSLVSGLEDDAAAEWLGCDENASPAVQKQNEARKANAPSSTPTPLGPDDSNSPSGAVTAAKPRIPHETAHATSEALVRLAAEEELAARSADLHDEASLPYHETQAWRKIRAHCMRRRLCVDFNRDSSCARCTKRFGECEFLHACAVCGSVDTGGPGAQYLHHSAWNCLKREAWLMSFK